MTKRVSVRLSLKELQTLRHAINIGAEDGSLIEQTDSGDLDPESEELVERVARKINEAIGRAS